MSTTIRTKARRPPRPRRLATGGAGSAGCPNEPGSGGGVYAATSGSSTASRSAAGGGSAAAGGSAAVSGSAVARGSPGAEGTSSGGSAGDCGVSSGGGTSLKLSGLYISPAKSASYRPNRPMTYVAFLRAINVGGNSIVSMAAIKEAMESIGLKDVRTYINSGNVVFSSPASGAPKLAQSIEMAIEHRTGLAVKVVVLSRAALKKVVDAIPAQWVDDKVMRCYVLLLWKDLDNSEI